MAVLKTENFKFDALGGRIVFKLSISVNKDGYFTSYYPKEAVEFYDELSRDEQFLAAKKSFAEFADHERKHVKLLEDFSDNKENLEKYDFKWIPDMKRSDYMVDTEYEKTAAFSLGSKKVKDGNFRSAMGDFEKVLEDKEASEIEKHLSYHYII